MERRYHLVRMLATLANAGFQLEQKIDELEKRPPLG
jgi:hypothetical protein